MSWIESHDDIWDHWKTEKLIEILSPHFDKAIHREELRALIVGQLQSLWHFVLRNAWRDANLEPWGDAGIERAARWMRSAGALTNALREVGYLDGFYVHGWLERAGRLVYDRSRNEKKRKSAVKRRNNGGKSKATLPYPTLPNPTLPYPTQKEDKPDASAPAHPRKKSAYQELIEHFASNRGVKLDNGAQAGRFFKTHGEAAKEILCMAGEDLARAKLAVTEIAAYADKQVLAGKWDPWKNLGAIANHYIEWDQEYRRDTEAKDVNKT